MSAIELNLLWENDKKALQNKIYMAIKLGYYCFAVNYFIEDFTKYITAKKKKEKCYNVPLPSEILIDEKEIESIKKSLGVKSEIRQLSRITVVVDDVNHTNKLQRDEVIRQYDLIAVQPESDKLLQVACSSLDVDIICLDLTQKMTMKLKRQTLGVAVERGIMLEVPYSPLIRDTTLRKNVITNAIYLCERVKGKNLMVSSRCEKPMELRGPEDVQNLAELFGLSEVQAKRSNTEMCRKCILHGETAGKRASKCIVSIIKIPEETATEGCKKEEVQKAVHTVQQCGEQTDKQDISPDETLTAKKRKLNNNLGEKAHKKRKRKKKT